MPSAWVEHIKEFAKRKGMTYGCALSDAECKAEYHAKKTPKTSKSAGGAEKENISMTITEKKARGRPKKYATEEERKKAKSAKTIESNKRKKAGKSAGGEKKEPEPTPAGVSVEKAKEAKALHDKYLSLHRAKYTTKIQKELEIVEGEINKITQPMLKEELEKNYFTDDDGKQIRFKLIPERIGYYPTHLSFTDEDGKVIDKLTKNGKENSSTDPYTELLRAIKERFKYRLFNRTAGLRNTDDLQSLLPNLLNTKPTGKGIRQELSKATKASEALAQSAKSMKGGMFPKDFMDGIGKSAGGARRDTTPPPTRPLTQEQAEAILRAINLPKKRRGRELGRVLDDIEGGDDRERMVRRFEGYVSGSRHPPEVRRIMLKFRRAYDESMGDATDSEGSDSSGAGAGLVPSGEETKKQILDSVAFYTEPKMKALKEATKKQTKALAGKGLIATHSAEDAGGLTHIYPLSHAHILEMCKHLI
jgi:hypothetical protein